MLSLSVSNSWPIHQLDVKNAFLHGDLNETVYMHQPTGFIDPRFPKHVCLLKRSLYGLKQAPMAWFNQLKQHLVTHGFRECQSNTLLFVHLSSYAIVYIVVYVDDLIIIGTYLQFI